MIDILEKNQPTTDAIDALIGFMTQDRTALGIPQGCLFVMMRAQSEHLGPSTCDKLNKVRQIFCRLLGMDRAGEVCAVSCINIPTDIAALLLDMQHGGAMRMQREGVSRETIESVLRFALGGLMFRDNAIRP